MQNILAMCLSTKEYQGTTKKIGSSFEIPYTRAQQKLLEVLLKKNNISLAIEKLDY